MKRLFNLLLAVVLTITTANVLAQGTGELPGIGSTHQYWVNGETGYGTVTSEGEGSTYIWWISTTPGNLLTRTSNTGHFQVTDGDYDTSVAGTSAGNGIELVWNPAAAGNTYYLVVEENDGSCTNIKAVAIQPVNAFEIVFAAIDESDADADDPSRCAPDIAVSASGTTITYDYGSDEYIYKISSSGLYSDWTFDYEFSNILGDASPTIEYSTDGSTYTSVGSSNTGVIVDSDLNGQKTVYFKVTLDNGDTTGGTFEEGLTGQSMVLTLTNISDGTNGPAHIYLSNGTTEFTGDIEQTQTVSPRPSTSVISSN